MDIAAFETESFSSGCSVALLFWGQPRQGDGDPRWYVGFEVMSEHIHSIPFRLWLCEARSDQRLWLRPAGLSGDLEFVLSMDGCWDT